MKKILLLNGPPSCGKDTAAKLLNEKLGEDVVSMYKMALPLKEACHKLLGLHGTLEELEPLKEVNIKFLVNTNAIDLFNCPTLINKHGDMTLRQFYMFISENVMKPMFGNDIFGRLAVENIKQCNKLFTTISDSGFAEEALPVISYFGMDNVLLVRVHRDGCNFSKDSRSYIKLPVVTLDLTNNGTMTEFSKKLLNEVKYFFAPNNKEAI